MKKPATLFILFVSAILAQDPADAPTKNLIARIREDPTDLVAIDTLRKRSDDPQIVPVLRDAFEKNRISGAKLDSETFEVSLSQVLAGYLYEMGVRDDIYFDEIAKHATTAIESGVPVAGIPGDISSGEPRVRTNPEFDTWCAVRSLDAAACRKLVNTHSNALSFLSGIRDRRSIPILRNALNMSNYAMVAIAVTGLAGLNDGASLSRIASACLRFSADNAQLIAIFAMDYDNPGVEALFDRFIVDRKVLSDVKNEWRARISKQAATEKKQ